MRSSRRRLSRNVYADATGIAVIARAGGHRREKRFPLDTPKRIWLAWQDEARAALRQAQITTPADPVSNTLHQDVQRFLRTDPDATTDSYLLAHWLERLGDRPRLSLTTADLRAVEATWQASAPQSIKHRRRALTRLYRALDGPDAPCPVRGLGRLATRPAEIRALPWATAQAIVAAAPDRGRPVKGHRRPDTSLSRIRLRLLLFTGLPPAVLKRLTPDAFDPEAGTLTLPPRQKGKGAAGRVIPLLPDAQRAFRDWVVQGAWGPFSTQALNKSWQRACATARAAGVQVPPCSLYTLRHTFLTHVLAVTGDLAATAELAQHASLAMTMRYTALAASQRATTALKKVAQAGGTAGPFPSKS